MGFVLPMPVLEPAQEEGDYVVVLENASLLPERVAQIFVRLTGWSQEKTAITVAKLPQPMQWLMYDCGKNMMRRKRLCAIINPKESSTNNF